MTGAEDLDSPIYPQYCFHLSPTIHQFCPLRSTDLQGLTSHPGFAGQDLYFHRNHPIKWVRITGVVVAIDEFVQRRVYTVDDSNGACIECVVTISVPPKPTLWPGAGSDAIKNKQETTIKDKKQDEAVVVPTVVLPEGLNVGSVVDVKGGLTVFRGNKQIKMEKITILRSTEQEVALWNKIRQFRQDVLSEPWTLSPRELRKCLKEAEGTTDAAAERKAKRRKLAGDESTDREREKTRGPSVSAVTGLERGNTIVTEKPIYRPRTTRSKVTGLERGSTITTTTTERPKTRSSRTTGLEKGSTTARVEEPRSTTSAATGLEKTRTTATEKAKVTSSRVTGLERRSTATTTEKSRYVITGLEKRSTATTERTRTSSTRNTGLEKISFNPTAEEPSVIVPRVTRLERGSTTTRERARAVTFRTAGLEIQSPFTATTAKPKVTRLTGLEKRKRPPVEVPANIKGKYSALGL